jgi:hypothetical protein
MRRQVERNREIEISALLCACGSQRSILNEQTICVFCIEDNRASEETALNFARAAVLEKPAAFD